MKTSYIILGIGLLVAIACVAVSMWKFHKDNSRPDFDMSDLLMENGRLSKLAVVLMGSYMMTSWVIVHLTITDKLTEGYLTVYCTAWVVPTLAKMLGIKISEPAAPAAPAQEAPSPKPA